MRETPADHSGVKATGIFPHCDASPSPLLGSTPQPTVCKKSRSFQPLLGGDKVFCSVEGLGSESLLLIHTQGSTHCLHPGLLYFSHTRFPKAPHAAKYYVRHKAPRVCICPHLHPYCQLAVRLSAVLGQ